MTKMRHVKLPHWRVIPKIPSPELVARIEVLCLTLTTMAIADELDISVRYVRKIIANHTLGVNALRLKHRRGKC
mgnify:CR=1 FL=1